MKSSEPGRCPGVYALGVTSKDEPGRERDVDRAWQDIVEHYGERAEVEADTAPPVAPEPEAVASTPPVHEQYDDEERFVPPPPPPLPRPEPRRQAAWIGLFASPLILLVFTVMGWHLPLLMSYALVLAFLGGFGYLVVMMPRGPRDPGDDGARI